VIQATRAQKLVLAHTRSAKRSGAYVFGDIKSSKPDAATSIVNQHGFIFFQAAHCYQQGPSR
jgi:hypothetical protein